MSTPSLCAFSFGLLGAIAACSSSDPPATGGAGGSSSESGAPAVAGAAPSSGGSTPASAGSSSAGSTSAGAANGRAGAGSAGAGTAGAGTAGGSAQAGAAGASGASTGGGGAPANVILNADFESDTSGKQPAGWHNFIAYNTDTTNPQGDLEAIVDATRAHGGKNSLHIKANGSSPVFVTLPLPSGANKLYVRGYFYMTRQLGQNPGANHETLLGIRKDKDNEIRFGEIKGVIGVNEVPTDNITPKMDLWGKGPLIAANKWACIEVAFIGDQSQHELHAWADGTDVLDVTSGDQWQNGTMPVTWLAGKWNEFMIGWQSFSSAANELWIDDLVLATSRVNCQ